MESANLETEKSGRKQTTALSWKIGNTTKEDREINKIKAKYSKFNAKEKKITLATEKEVQDYLSGKKKFPYQRR